MEMSEQLHALAVLPSGKSLPVPLARRLGGPQSRSGRCGEEKKFAPTLNLTLDVRPGAIPTPIDGRIILKLKLEKKRCEDVFFIQLAKYIP
jgi:hypothetical protein